MRWTSLGAIRARSLCTPPVERCMTHRVMSRCSDCRSALQHYLVTHGTWIINMFNQLYGKWGVRKWRVTWSSKTTLSSWKQLTAGNFAVSLTVLKSEKLLLRSTQLWHSLSVQVSFPHPDTFTPPPGFTREWFTATWGLGVNESSTPGNIPPCLFTTPTISHKHRDSSKLFPPFLARGQCIITASIENTEDPLTS